jgi:folate-binding protein YgfZ
MSPGEARDTAMITSHGRMTGYLETVATEDAIMCHFEPELRDTLPEALGRYVFATQVEIQDVTDDRGLILTVGDRALQLVRRECPVAVVHPTSSFGTAASYLWVPPRDLGALVGALRRSDVVEGQEVELEALRIAEGMPRWGRDMGPKTIPQEAGIEDRAVHFDKGCYLGQEAMAKIHFRGKVNRRLFRLKSEGALRAGADVMSVDGKVGMVTSAAGGRALALLRYDVEPGSEVQVEDVPASVTLV